MKKYAPYILILLVLVFVGLFSPIMKVNALDSTIPAEAPAPKPEPGEFEKWAKGESCGVLGTSSIDGCIKAIFYYVVYTPSAILLAISATFFNALISIALSTEIFSASSDFISTAWRVVRDLSNMFFILILLYIAIKIILDLGTSEAKKMISKVIIIALLINFSMFFTKVIIDSSNILALIFYNKLDVSYKNSTGDTAYRPYKGATGEKEKDLSGSMYNGFDVTSKLNGDFWAKTMETTGPNGQKGETLTNVPTGTMVGIILVASAIMLFAAYAFLVSGLAFVGRVIELFVLIIFSPFAFMSFTNKDLASTSYIGWEAWSKRLIKVSFMAPIFMFFMYLIFLLLNAKLFSNLVTTQQDWLQTILGAIIPGIMVMVLLLKATKFAKDGSGAFGEAVMKSAKIAGGLALGAATGGAAMMASNSIGRLARNAANNDETKAKAAAGDKGAQRRLALANSMAKNSFDLRQTGIGKLAADKSGMNFSKGLGVVGMGTDNLKGGRKGRDEERDKKHDEKIKSYELSKSEAIKQENFNKNYIKERDKAKTEAEKSGSEFNENKFKSSYETYAGRKVGTPAEVNKERREAYAVSLENPDKKMEDGKAIKKGLTDYKSSFKAGVANMTMTSSGLATTAAVGAATAGIGLAVAPLVGGLAQVLKDYANDKLAANKLTGMVFSEHKEAIATIRKGFMSKDAKFLNAVKEFTKEDGGHATPKPAPKAHAPAPEEKHGPTPAAHAPTTDSAHAPAGGGGHGGGHH